MKKWNIALGYYQELPTAHAVISELKQRHFSRFATIHHKHDNTIEINRYFPLSTLVFPLLGFLALICLFLLKHFLILNLSWGILLLTAGMLLATTGIYTFWHFSGLIDLDVVNRFKNRVIVDEILIIVQVRQRDIRDVLSILRQVKSGHPVTFLLRPAMFEEGDVEIPSEPLSLEMQSQEATKLADAMPPTSVSGDYRASLLQRFKKSNQVLRILRNDITDAEYIEQTMPSSAEWLLDNMYVIEGSIEDVKLNLPKKYYKELPKLTKGPLAGYPRIYALAIELIKNSAGRLNRETIINFLDSYQVNHPLTIGELWAFPLMLRFRLIEWIEFLAIHVDNRMREGELAHFWGNRLLYAARHEPSRLESILSDLSREHLAFSGHFAEELLDHLFDEEAVLPMVRKWLEDHFALPLADILHEEHIHETTEQVVFSNSIKSLITLSQLSWPNIFEAVSPVDVILREDPDGIYSQMDFTTRNCYREAIEEIAHHVKIPEVEVAKKTLSLAHKGDKEFDKHIGYYLIDDGRETLENRVGYHPAFFQSIRRWIIKHPATVYLGGIITITLLLEILLFSLLLTADFSFLQITLFSILSLLPLSELSVQLVNIVLTMILPTSLRPKMLFESGIPQVDKTLVVVPMMLTTPDSIREEIDRLEIRYLANTDPQLSFGLFSDFTDSPTQHLEKDASLLAIAIEGLQALEHKYGVGKFFLFHRQRVWSKSENAWIGWERKRGKLEYLNRFLMGETLPENIVYMGHSDALKGTRYVITLDADTQLPKDQAKAMIEVLSHPLNRPYLAAEKNKLLRGYTIIQPRVGTDFVHSKASWFCKIFSEQTVVDPYTQAISNIYQDLVGEGSYHGKGIYDVAAFHSILSHHFPEEHLLSHDLLEGAFVRVGFASHICLFDIHPKDYLSWSGRQERWIRGDWQIIDWLMPTVPIARGKTEVNPLSKIDRWKIFDNLRRSLLPIALMLLLVVGWIFSPIPGIWTSLATLILILPCISLFSHKIFSYSFAPIKSLLMEMMILGLRTLIRTALLPFEALVSINSILRVAYRRMISHRNLLQWTACGCNCNSQKKLHRKFVLKLGGLSFFALLILVIVGLVNPIAELMALPFCLLWILAPFIVNIIDRPLDKRIVDDLSALDQEVLRKIGRKTWRYFEELVGPATHWLPPDNYQTALNVEVAQRTSPSNIGLWLMSAMSAYDFRYITCDTLIDKTLATIQELKKLERYEGHFLNWYNIQTLEPLFPRYVSTVDSGNLLACFWTLKHGMYEMISSPIIPTDVFLGIKDSFKILEEIKTSSKIEEAHQLFNLNRSDDLPHFSETIKKALSILQPLSLEDQNVYWLRQIVEELNGWDSTFSRYFLWVEVLTSLSEEQLKRIDPQAKLWRDQVLSWKPSLDELANKKIPSALEKLMNAAQRDELPHEIKGWAKRLLEAFSTSQWFAGEKLGLVSELMKDIDQFTHEMNLKFLYNADRKLFSIGYNVDDRRLDPSYYDLLASEARIASLVAIAKEDVPLEHWWALGRLYSKVQGRKVLLSWGGTMFEYLMPLIFNKQYPDSLIGEACDAAVACQIAYGKKRGIPWGISESAYCAIDSHKIYQYKSFGIPGLGLKRGLESDLVVSPYSTALALAVDVKSAVKNFKKMAEKKNLNLMGSYGYYESMDFTRQRSPKGERGVVVSVYMAHHQGMILSAINNTINNDALIKRFHKDPRICGVNSLLYERIPSSPPIKIKGIRKDPTLRRLQPFSQKPVMGVVETPESVTPKINLLSNGSYSLVISNTGGGYSRWGDVDIYRWRADTTQDAWGSFYYIKDMRSSEVWSAAYQPTQNSGKEYSVNFKDDKSEFRRKDHAIETFTEIVVSPEDNAEIRLITLINHSNETRHIEVTSYLELALAPHITDRSHPCFNKLFIETEALPDLSALLAFRRLRSPEDRALWAVHLVSTSHPSDENIQYETDRSRFIGRGKTLKRPAALEGDLSNTAGTVLDPIFSLRRRVIILPGGRIQLSFITAITDNRPAAEALIEKYKDIASSHRALELAWTYSQLELRHLRIHQEEVQLFQKLASRIIYPHLQLRSVDRLLRNRLGQSGLWSQGISGDLPIVVVTVGDIYDVDLVKQLLIAHAFWSLRGLKVDLVILNEEEMGYFQPLQEHLQSLIQGYSYRSQIDTPGGVFLRSSSQVQPEELNLILSVARAVLIAARGTLRQQLVSPKPKGAYPPKLLINEQMREEPSRPLPFLELPYFNGLGGFSTDGRSYVIYLEKHMNTPAPWINVLANPQFGTLVSEAGLGCTWYGNSQTNRLTPWSNDPLLNPISDTIYIRDEEMGTVWTPTPNPIRELDPYRISHSQGFSRFEHNSHGIDQELLVFVPVDDEGGLPLRIQRVRLSNHSSRRRRLTLTAYSEWILGNDKEETQMQVITEWDSESQAMFAYNYYNPDFGSHVAFSTSVIPPLSFTGDRTEFLGRNRSTSSPVALSRKSLSGTTGAGLDPCSALQVSIELDPEQEAEVVFIMGYATDAATARQLILQCRNNGTIERLFSDTKSWWSRTLETIQVDVPDLATNFFMNRWLMYQDLCCRFWARAGFYQSSGAYGFRDQLQDVMAIVYSIPTIARDYILKAASRQYIEGDVQHWWHPQTGAGIRTRCSDDLLWLPFVTAHYVRVTGDVAILEEKIPFLEGDKLADDQEELFQIPTISQETATLLEHCRRAINKGNTKGIHGLPLIGSCDWNDGMNRVGIHGKGESVWLAWFLIHVMNDFADLLTFSDGNSESGEGFRVETKRLAEIVETTAWDGAWYRRAYFDNGAPLGSKEGTEAIIDSLTQSWAVISGLANPERSTMALHSADEYLVKAINNIVLLLTPPFDKTPLDPGYIKGYPPGVRENGGQYTHGSSWLAMAYARVGNGNKAVELLKMLAPTAHTPTLEANALYRVEPYVIAADIYDLKNQVGRGGWTWYTGSAGWIYRIWLEEILGFKLRSQNLSFNCTIPKEWNEFKVNYRYKSSHYEILVTNPHHISRGSPSISLDGVLLSSTEIPLVDDGNQHIVTIVLNS